MATRRVVDVQILLAALPGSYVQDDKLHWIDGVRWITVPVSYVEAEDITFVEGDK